MVELIVEIGLKALASFLTVCLVGILLPEILHFGDNRMQAAIVFSFYVYCLISILTFSRHKLFHVLSIPIFTQFVHLFQKYDFTAGANSIWRILPFLILNAYFLLFIVKRKISPTPRSRLFLVVWSIFQFIFLSISPNLEKVFVGGGTLWLLTLPAYYLYISYAAQNADFQQNLLQYFFLLYLILGLGTFGLVAAAAAYKGSDNLLATRNISDTNVTMAYFILLWPFALLFVQDKAYRVIGTLGIMVVFIGIVVFSFSRGAVFIVFPYLLTSVCITSRIRREISMAAIGVTIALTYLNISSIPNTQDLSYFWRLRFGELQSSQSLVQRLEATSGRAEIHRIAYDLFVHKPLLGNGTGSFEILGPGYREAHSLLYTLLAEQGMVGTIYMYSLFGVTGWNLLKAARIKMENGLLLLGFMFYLIFNHTVGSVFVIIPAKSITVNCIAPILLLCIHFYANNLIRIQRGREEWGRF